MHVIPTHRMVPDNVVYAQKANMQTDPDIYDFCFVLYVVGERGVGK